MKIFAVFLLSVIIAGTGTNILKKYHATYTWGRLDLRHEYQIQWGNR